VNTNIDAHISRIRNALLQQVVIKNPEGGIDCAKGMEITFPKQMGKKDARFFTVDLTADNSEHFKLIKRTEFTLNGATLATEDTGPPTPTNLAAISVHVFEAEILSVTYAGNRVLISRIPLAPSASGELPFEFLCVQFPVRLAFAMMIHKSQGQTFNRIGVVINEPVFCHSHSFMLPRTKRRRSAAGTEAIPS
jgi:hypothetical protein